MNTTHRYKQRFFLSSLIMAANIGPVQAQYSGPYTMPIPSQVQLMNDQQNVQQLESSAERYTAQVNEYITEIKNEIGIINAHDQEYLRQIQLIEKKAQHTPHITNAEKTELSALRAKIHDD